MKDQYDKEYLEEYALFCQVCGLLRIHCECIDDCEEDYIHEGNFYPICNESNNERH